MLIQLEFLGDEAYSTGVDGDYPGIACSTADAVGRSSASGSSAANALIGNAVTRNPFAGRFSACPGNTLFSWGCGVN